MSANQEQLGVRSPAIEDYAKAIYALEMRAGASVSTNALADRLRVTPASASGMVKRMGELGLVEHRRYHGVSLTENGRRIALEVMRHHRLLELYLVKSREARRSDSRSSRRPHPYARSDHRGGPQPELAGARGRRDREVRPHL